VLNTEDDSESYLKRLSLLDADFEAMVRVAFLMRLIDWDMFVRIIDSEFGGKPQADVNRERQRHLMSSLPALVRRMEQFLEDPSAPRAKPRLDSVILAVAAEDPLS